MATSEKDIKLLWGRAAGRCSFPNCSTRLTQDKRKVSSSFALGIQAHIVAKEPDAPRGKSILSPEERDSYFNLILLCPTHHEIIDKNPEEYPVEKLHLMKQQHEFRVEESLSKTKDEKKVAQQVVYSNLIDAAVEDCRLKNWEGWTSWALAPVARWDKDAPHRLFKFRQKILAAAFPGILPELERALQTLSIAMLQAINTFIEHCDEDREGNLRAILFYKEGRNGEKRSQLLSLFEEWQDQCNDFVIEATKAANWVAEVVRKYINPLFFAIKGKFLVTYGPTMPDMRFETRLFEYTKEEKKQMPKSLLSKVKKIEDKKVKDIMEELK